MREAKGDLSEVSREVSGEKEWREFEELVARIEESLVPHGAVVRSPDRVSDLATGELREVDASIRMGLGSTEVLITIECRRRKGVQDVTWIEQLAAKRRNVGASKTIAVSSKGFTQPAIEMARREGIELRRMADITKEEIGHQWLRGFQMSLIVTDYNVDAVGVKLDDGGNLALGDWAPETLTALREPEALDYTIAFQLTNDKPITINGLLAGVAPSGLQPGGSPVRARVRAAFAPRSAYMKTIGGRRFISELELDVEFSQTERAMDTYQVIQYGHVAEPLIQITQGSVVHDGIKYTLEATTTPAQRTGSGPNAPLERGLHRP